MMRKLTQRGGDEEMEWEEEEEERDMNEDYKK